MCNSMGNEPVEVAIISFLKHEKVYYQRSTLFFLIFAENIVLLSLNIIKLIPLGAPTWNYKKSAFSMWLYEGENSLGHILN